MVLSVSVAYPFLLRSYAWYSGRLFSVQVTDGV